MISSLNVRIWKYTSENFLLKSLQKINLGMDEMINLIRNVVKQNDKVGENSKSLSPSEISWKSEQEIYIIINY